MLEIKLKSFTETQMTSRIRIGLSEKHGMAEETSQNPPEGVEFCFPAPKKAGFRLIRSGIKGYLREFNDKSLDAIESVLTPVKTPTPWICSLDCYPAAIAYNILGVPLPRAWRNWYIGRLFKQSRCIKIVFWSKAALEEMADYNRGMNREILSKSTYVYPAIRRIDSEKIKNHDSVQLLFSGDFFRKGGAAVVDAFYILRGYFPSLSLNLCCSEEINFQTANSTLRNDYLRKIHSCPGITMGRIPRVRMLSEILPRTDIYLLPTYQEAFGFAILEAMAFGIPVVATNHYAIPEIISDGKDGFLIDINRFSTKELFKNYRVDNLPVDLHRSTVDQLVKTLRPLIESRVLRESTGEAARQTVRNRFSFEQRNREMLPIYQKCADFKKKMV